MIEAHSEEYATELRRYLAAEELTLDPPHRTPPQSEAWQCALDYGWVKNSAEACNLLALDDDTFEREVGIDITGNTLAALREPGILLRWQATLKVLSEKHSARGVPSDPLARARASRFHAALMQRQAEAKRLSKDVHLQVISLVDRHNDKPVRQRLQRMARATILARYADELDKNAPGTMPPKRP